MTDPIRRAIRTLLVLLAAATPGVPALAAVFDVPAGRVAQVLGVFTFVGVMLTALLNHVEDNTSFPALLKAPASEGENPVPDPPKKKARKAVKKQAGQVDIVTALVVVFLVVVILLVLSGGDFHFN